MSSGMLCDIRYPSVTHLKLKSCENSFTHNFQLNNPIILKLCTEHGSMTAVLCAKCQNDWMTKTYVMDEQVFTKFEFKMHFGRISYTAQGPSTIFGDAMAPCIQIINNHGIANVRWTGTYLPWGSISSMCAIIVWRNHAKFKWIFIPKA